MERPPLLFTDLPAEMQHRTLELLPRSAPTYSLVSHGFQELTSDMYWNLCQKPITLEERLKYVRTEPHTFAAYQNHGNRMKYVESMIYQSQYYIDRQNHKYLGGSHILTFFAESTLDVMEPGSPPTPVFVSTIYYLGSTLDPSNVEETIKPLVEGWYINQNPPTNPQVALDLVSEYRILLQRVGCGVRSQGNFARNRILGYLDAIYRSAQTSTDVRLLSEAYVHFYTESMLHNLYPLPKIINLDEDSFFADGTSPVRPTGVAELKAEIERLYPLLRRSIEGAM